MMMTLGAGTMAQRHSISEARRNLPSLVREAENGKTVELTRRGETVVVLVGRHEFARLSSRWRSFGNAYREFASTVELAGLALDPDELFGNVRCPSSARSPRPFTPTG